MQWQIIKSGRLPPQAIMDKDKELLNQLSETSLPILHLYEWEGACFTYGYFIDPFKYLNVEAVQNHKFKMARRPTGGGIIFHLTDFAFSVLIPAHDSHFSLNTLDNYAFVNHMVAQAISQLSGQTSEPELLAIESVCSDRDCRSFCMAKPTQYDIIVNRKKVGGASQRRTKKGFLHQGSISLALPPQGILEDVLKQGTRVWSAMQEHSYVLLEGSWTEKQLSAARAEIQQLLIQCIANRAA